MPKLEPKRLQPFRISVVTSDSDLRIGRFSGTNPAREAMKRQEAEVVAEAQRKQIEADKTP